MDDFDAIPTEEWIGRMQEAAADRGSIPMLAAGRAFEKFEAQRRRALRWFYGLAVAGCLALFVMGMAAGAAMIPPLIPEPEPKPEPAPAWVRISGMGDGLPGRAWQLPATVEINGRTVTIALAEGPGGGR